MPFSFTPLAIADLILVEPKVFSDNRGFFLRDIGDGFLLEM
jgi:dTDP-4-dehydrorhamnose 3,5-epimerase-like enzyme